MARVKFKTAAIAEILTRNSIVCDDGTVSLVFSSKDLNIMVNTLKTVLNTESSTTATQKQINKVIKMLSYDSQYVCRKQIKNLIAAFNRDTYKMSEDKVKHRTRAFHAYYSYFVGMKITRMVMLQKSKNDIIVLIFDKHLIYRFNISNPTIWDYKNRGYIHSGHELNNMSVYDINSENIRRPLFKFDSHNCNMFNNINNILTSQVNEYMNEIKENLGEDGLSRNKMIAEKTPPINDIFNTLKDVDEKYIYFQYGKKVKCSSDFLLITLRMI